MSSLEDQQCPGTLINLGPEIILSPSLLGYPWDMWNSVITFIPYSVLLDGRPLGVVEQKGAASLSRTHKPGTKTTHPDGIKGQPSKVFYG